MEEIVEETVSEEKRKEEHKDSAKSMQQTAVGLSSAHSAQQSVKGATIKFAKPDTYTGNRNYFDGNGKAIRKVKENSFASGEQVRDAYTGEMLELRVADAKRKYGADWKKHLAEGDHIVPLEKIFRDSKNNPWLSKEDIKNIANSDENMQTVSRQFNNGKRNRTNEEFVKDRDYLKKIGLELSEEGKQKAIVKGKETQTVINKKVRKTVAREVLKTGHEAGKCSAGNAVAVSIAMSSANNIVSVVKGEKKVGEAIADVATDTGKSAATGYLMGAGLTTISHTLASAPSQFLQSIAKSTVPGQIVTFLMMTGSTFKSYIKGEISTRELAEEIGQKGAEMLLAEVVITTVGSIVGGPIVGALAAMLASAACSALISWKRKLESDSKIYQSRLSQMKKIEENALREIQYQRKRLENIIKEEFQGWDESFESGFQMMINSIQNNNFVGFADGLDRIMKIFESEAMFHEEGEVEKFLFDNELVFEF